MTKVAPKEMNFATTKGLEHRVALMVGIDSIGYLPYLTEVTIKLGFSLNASAVKFLKRRDERAEYMRKHRMKKATKIRRRERTDEKIKKQIADDKKARAQSLYYQSGIAVQNDMVIHTECQTINTETEDGHTSARKKRKTKDANIMIGAREKKCASCNQTGHSRRSSVLCELNPKNRLHPNSTNKQ